MKKYWTSLTVNYCNDWTPANAVREICQNNLDSPAPFEYDLSGDTLEFTSKGITIPPSSLLMGVSTKREDLTTVGGKGEGFKLAAVVLLREGYGLTIYNGSRKWEPAFEYHPDYDQELLCFTETPYSGSDLTFEITGADDKLIEEVIHDCLYLQKDLGDVVEGERGRVLLNKFGKLYVGGLFVCDISGYKHSYDFHPKYLPLNRDRKSVDSWKLAPNVTELLEEVMPAKELAQLVSDRSADAGGYYSSFTKDEVAEEVYNLAKESYGNNVVVVEDGDEKEKLEKRGYRNVEVVYNDNERKLIQKAPSYQEFLEVLESVVDAPEPEDTRSPVEMLEDWYADESGNCTDWIKFETLLDTFKQRGVSFDD